MAAEVGRASNQSSLGSNDHVIADWDHRLLAGLQGLGSAVLGGKLYWRPLALLEGPVVLHQWLHCSWEASIECRQARDMVRGRVWRRAQDR